MIPFTVIAQFTQMFPRKQSRVVLIVPLNLDRVISREFCGFDIDRDGDILDVNHPLVREFVDACGTRAPTSQIAKRNFENRIIGPSDFKDLIGSNRFQVFRWVAHDDLFRRQDFFKAHLLRNSGAQFVSYVS
jgi:hypothetical protein